MSLVKNYIKSRNSCKVTFQLPKQSNPEGKEVRLLGEFNEWNWEKAPILKPSKSAYQVKLELAAGRAYQYRYLIDGQEWVNDSSADSYTPSPYYLVDNCVVQLDNCPEKKTPGSKPSTVDFTKIEGIGPKINQIFQEAGFSSYEELGKAKKVDLQSILKVAGKRYQMHDPSTWPKQAKLLADNKLKELAKLQKKLKGGRKA